ncbi:hypothetical protein [Salininema proteolyticum]|uniref:Uncharacterized protein n=1 Tax=Salininema proteolyticum TaxID=1607685 RepID=A0ABV8TTR6_9ACTN
MSWKRTADRAASEWISLSAYLRQLVHEEAARPTNAEVIQRIEAERPVEATMDEVRSFIEAERWQ